MAVFKVSIELRTLAVLWAHFCVDRTADLSSFMDTFSMFKDLPDLGSFMDTFRLSVKSVHKTVGPRNSVSQVIPSSQNGRP